jgi:hypothetical protein
MEESASQHGKTGFYLALLANAAILISWLLPGGG